MSEREMVIAGVTVTVSTPYAEGHTVNAAEAKTLNQTRCENISNAMRTKIKEALEAGADQSAIQEMVSKYDAEYTFSLASAGGGRRAVDPLEREALAIARAEVTRLIKEQGLKVKDVDKEVVEQNVAAFAEHPDVIALAKKRLKEKEKLAGGLQLAM